MAVISEAIVSAFLLAYLAAGVALFLSSWLRSLPFTRRFFVPRRFDVHQAVKPPRLHSGYLLWIWQLLRVPENEVISVAGLDSAVYLRALRMMWIMLALISTWCLALVLPINLSGHEVDALLTAPPAPSAPAEGPEQEASTKGGRPSIYDMSYFDRCSLSNVPRHSDKLYVHVFSSYVVTGIVLTILWKYNKEMTVLRLLFLATSPKGGPSHTVLVQDIPGTEIGTVPWALKQVLGTTVFRFLPASLRDQLVELVDDFVFGGLGQVWGRVRGKVQAWASARRARPGRARARAMSRWARDDSHSSAADGDYNFVNYRQHAKELRRAPADAARPVRDSDSGAATPSALEGTAPELENGDTDDEAEAETEAEARSRLPADVLSYADRLNLELEPRGGDAAGRLKLDVRAVKGRSLDVWGIAVDYLSQQPEPGQPPPSLEGMVEAEFRHVYGDEVAAVNLVWDQSELDPLFAEFNKLRTQLEDYLDWAAGRLRRRKALRRKLIRIIPLAYPGWGSEKFGVKPVRVEALHFWCERLRYLVGQMREARARARGFRATSAAFVTFNSRVAQAVSASSLHQHVEYLWRVQPAPDAGEVLWGNVRMRSWERNLRLAASWGLFFGLLCCYFVPVAAIQGLIAVPKLTALEVLNAPALIALVQSVGPALGLKIFMVFAPYLLDLICRFAGHISESAVDFAVVKLFYGFQIVALFLGSVISGSFLNQLQRILNQPSDVLLTMATSLPQTSSFFITYTLVAGLTAYALDFLRPGHLALFLVRSRLVSTPRQRERLWADRYVKYSWSLPDNMMVFLFGLVFCIMNPIMCIAAMSYFSIVLVFERFNNLYVYKRKYESGGRVWVVIFHQMMTALYIMQVTLMLAVSLRSLTLFVLVIPAIAVTVAFHLLCTMAFTRPWSVLSLHDASYLDHQDRQMQQAAGGAGGRFGGGGGGESLTEAEKAAIREMYLSPVFKASEMDIGELLLEAEKVRRLIEGESLDSILHDFVERGLIRGQGSETGEKGQQGGARGDGSERPPPAGGGGAAAAAAAYGTSAAGGRAGGVAASSAAGRRTSEGPHHQQQQQQQRRVRRRVRFQGDVDAGGSTGGDGGSCAGAASGGTAAPASGWWWWWWWGPNPRGLWWRAPASSGARGVEPASAAEQPLWRSGEGRGGGVAAVAAPAASVLALPPSTASAVGSAAASPTAAAAAGPETALALVSALISHVSAMNDAGRRQLQDMLQLPFSDAADGASVGEAAAARQREWQAAGSSWASSRGGPSDSARSRRKTGR